MNIKQVKDLLKYLIHNNETLIQQNENRIVFNLEGESGIGKTFCIKQLAQELNAYYTCINLSNIEDPSDLCGMPIKEYAVISPSGEQIWVVEKVLPQFIDTGYTLCSYCQPRTSYAKPAWVPEESEQLHILFLDDYSRSNALIMNALMQILQFGEYISWSLPKNVQIILSSNPDNGNYLVQTLDPAQMSRVLTLQVDFDEKVWAEWAYNNDIKSQLINFALLTPEIFNNDLVNARSYSMFARSLNSVSDISTAEGLSKMSLLSEGCFGKDNTIGAQLLAFVHNKLDKLPEPEMLLKADFNELVKELEKLINTEDGYRADIAGVLTMRFNMYVQRYFKESSDKKKSEAVINRIIEFIEYNNTGYLLSNDLLYVLIRELYKEFPTRISKYLLNPTIKSILI